MSLRTRLILSITAFMLVLILVVLGITSVFSSIKFIWNSNVELQNEGRNLDFEIAGLINGSQSFLAISENGVIDNSNWEIPRSHTTFTKTKKIIVLQFVFTNKSNSELRVIFSDILIDPAGRFVSQATNENNMEFALTRTALNTASFETVLGAGVGTTMTINLTYTLEKTNLPITAGGESDTQNLLITVANV